MNYTSALFAAAVTIYYWWQNIKGIEESSDKALRVMQITTVMVVILFIWGAYSVCHARRVTCLRRRSRRTSSSATMRSASCSGRGCRSSACSAS